jgi:hypothetical protein
MSIVAHCADVWDSILCVTQSAEYALQSFALIIKDSLMGAPYKTSVRLCARSCNTDRQDEGLKLGRGYWMSSTLIWAAKVQTHSVDLAGRTHT